MRVRQGVRGRDRQAGQAGRLGTGGRRRNGKAQAWQGRAGISKAGPAKTSAKASRQSATLA